MTFLADGVLKGQKAKERKIERERKEKEDNAEKEEGWQISRQVGG
jgi:hypothetical protein